MNQNYGALRVVRMLISHHAPVGEAHTQGRSSGGWLPEDGLVHVLTRRETALGRALNNDVILLDLSVSREHALLLLDEGGWHITNLTTQNVVRVNGRTVPGGDSLPVHPQDILVLGNTMLQLIAPRDHRELLSEPESWHPEINSSNGSQTHHKDHATRHTLPLTEQNTPPSAIVGMPESVNAQFQLDSAESARYETPLPFLPTPRQEEEHWGDEEPESVLGAGITMQFALPQRMGKRTRWFIVGVGMTLLLISALITIILNGLIGLSALEQNGVSAFLTALTIPLLPAVGIFLLVNFMDRFEREPWFLRLAAFLWGAIIAIPPALFIEKQIDTLLSNWLASNGNNVLIHALYQALNAGITEETIKGLGLILLFIILRDEFDNVTDGIVYGALIGAGFAMVEIGRASCRERV